MLKKDPVDFCILQNFLSYLFSSFVFSHFHVSLPHTHNFIVTVASHVYFINDFY